MNTHRVETGAVGDRRRSPVRRETLLVLIEQLWLAQRTSQWLANETHGDAYTLVRELNEHLHQAQCRLRDIEGNTAVRGGQAAGGTG